MTVTALLKERSIVPTQEIYFSLYNPRWSILFFLPRSYHLLSSHVSFPTYKGSTFNPQPFISARHLYITPQSTTGTEYPTAALFPLPPIHLVHRPHPWIDSLHLTHLKLSPTLISSMYYSVHSGGRLTDSHTFIERTRLHGT